MAKLRSDQGRGPLRGDLPGGKWTHKENPNLESTGTAWIGGEGVYRLILNVGGNFKIGEDASIDVTGMGFAAQNGLGFVANNGASHGGLGGESGEVKFPEVTKPSDTAGFFAIGVKETSDVNPPDHGIVVPGPVRIDPER